MNLAVRRWTLFGIFLLLFSVASHAQVAVGISVRIGPPALPVYAQPICPGPGFFWTPGYWAWNDDAGYYWVPGTWVVAPVGMFWTPGWWGWGGGFYLWHTGYWGPHVGFYGGINYGYGYTGVGFVGGEWRGGAFYYNRSVTNVSVTNVTNVYNRTVIVNNNSTTSFNGGTAGVQARPTAQEEAWGREAHTAALPAQVQQEHAASQQRQNFASVNQGRPAVAATARPGDFSTRSAVAARSAGAAYHPSAMSPREARVTPAAARRDSSNDGFRPFTPPSKSTASSANVHGANPNQGNNGSRGDFRPPQSTSRPSASSESRPYSRPNDSRTYGNSSHGNSGRPNPQPRYQGPPPRQSPPPKEERRR